MIEAFKHWLMNLNTIKIQRGYNAKNFFPQKWPSDPPKDANLCNNPSRISSMVFWLKPPTSSGFKMQQLHTICQGTTLGIHHVNSPCIGVHLLTDAFFIDAQAEGSTVRSLKLRFIFCSFSEQKSKHRRQTSLAWANSISPIDMCEPCPSWRSRMGWAGGTLSRKNLNHSK